HSTMRYRPAFMFAALIAYAHPALAQAPTRADTTAVIAATQRLLDAISAGDSAMARSVLLPRAQLSAVRGGDAPPPPRITADTSFLRSIAATRGKSLERLWSPVVRIRGNMADVWAPYDFYVDGKFSHCGVDTFTLMRTAGEWRIAAVAYTVEP